MISTALVAAIVCSILVFMQFASLAVSLWRITRKMNQDALPETLPFIAVMRPLCGKDTYEEETLRSSFLLDYPDYEILFCVASQSDPVVELVEKLMAEYPEQRARLLVGDDKISANPKLNNLNKAWFQTSAKWAVMADSNLLLPANYLQLLLSSYDEEAGMVSSPAIGVRPKNFWGALEAATLNTYQARWQFLSDWAGAGFAQGKTMFWRRDVLDNGGGMPALGREIAEDLAATKVVRRAGLKVRLTPQPFAHPIGKRSLTAVWSRQLRWARIRRSGVFWLFLPEITQGLLPALIAAIYLAASGNVSWYFPSILTVLWYAAEWIFARTLGWPHKWRDVLAMLIRDIMLPALWIWCWAGRSFVWRGTMLKNESSATVEEQHGK